MVQYITVDFQFSTRSYFGSFSTGSIGLHCLLESLLFYLFFSRILKYQIKLCCKRVAFLIDIRYNSSQNPKPNFHIALVRLIKSRFVG